MKSEWQWLVQQLKDLYGTEDIPLHEPFFNQQEINYVTDCVQSGWVSSVGQYVNDFEQQLQNFTGVKHAIAVVNGTAALHIALKLAKVEPNDEVLVPALTFIATVNAISYCGAIPHFVDVHPSTLGVDPFVLRAYLEDITIMKGATLYNKHTGRRISAILPMHTFGHAVHVQEILQLAKNFHLTVVEDAAESLGTFYNATHTGNFGQLSAISFNGNKIITTGGGGAILTNDTELAKQAKHITTTAKIPHSWAYQHDAIGYNYRMPNLNAALGCAQLEKLPRLLQEKHQLTVIYENLFQSIEGATLFKAPSHSKSNYWLQTMLLKDASIRDEVLNYFNTQGVMCRPIWTPIQQLPMYKQSPAAPLPQTSYLEQRIINLPSSPLLKG